MAQEEKQLLLVDLCGRLPYGVIVQYKSREKKYNVVLSYGNISYVSQLGEGWWSECKPYLRPMSSMTEEEEQEYRSLCGMQFADELADANTTIYYFDTIESFDWLNKKMFDYRGLIPLGSALEAPEGMYNN